MNHSVSPDHPPQRHTLWSDARAAILGSRQDFTSGSIGRAVFILSVPMIIEMVGQSIFGIVDAFFVGRLGAASLAAVGLTDSLLTIVFAVALGLAMATTAFVARRVGEGDPEAASRGALQALILGTLVSLPFALAGVIFAPACSGCSAPRSRQSRSAPATRPSFSAEARRSFCSFSSMPSSAAPATPRWR